MTRMNPNQKKDRKESQVPVTMPTAATGPQIQVSQLVIRGLRNHLTKVKVALDPMTPQPRMEALVWGEANNSLKLMRGNLAILTDQLADLQAKTFPTEQAKEAAANKMARKVMMLGRQVMELGKDPKILVTQMPQEGELTSNPMPMVIKTDTGEEVLIDPVTQTAHLDPGQKLGPKGKLFVMERDLNLLFQEENLEAKIWSTPEEKARVVHGMANRLLSTILDQKDPNNLDLWFLLQAMHQMKLLKPTAREEVQGLLDLSREMKKPISLWELGTLDRVLSMKEMATKHRTYPLLMRQAWHRNPAQHDRDLMEQELLSPNQSIFLTTVPLKMLLS